MITNIDHLGIAVANINDAIELYTKLFNVTEWHREHVSDQGVEIASFVLGSIRIELTAASQPDSPIARFIEKRGEGIHHVALYSNDLRADLDIAESKGMRLIDKEPRSGAHNMQIAFLHPSTTKGVLMEFCSKTDTH